MVESSNKNSDFGGCELDEKSAELKKIIASLEKVLVAYSGGVDSTLLLKICKDVLGDEVIAVTALSETIPKKEVDEAIRLAGDIGVVHEIIRAEPLKNHDFVANSSERCYYCKHDLHLLLQKIAEREGASFIIDGTNYDDADDFRPGRKAASELGVRSPLLEAGLTKEDVRTLSQFYQLPTWDKPSMACLASRFPYGHEITAEKLKKVEEAEEFIRNLGLKQVRVRLHDNDTARIEIESEMIGRLLESDTRSQIVGKLQKLGFTYITLDLKGYQTGSMNELLKETRN